MVHSRTIAVRVAVIAVVTVALQVGPVMHQLFGLPNPPLTMSWSMYSGVGLDLCTVRYEAAGAPIDRRDALGLPPIHEASPGERFLRSPAAVREAARPLCEARPGVAITARAWCGTGRDGRWARAVDPEEALCPR